MGRGSGGNRKMQPETKMFGNNESQQNRRARQQQRLRQQRMRGQVNEALNHPINTADERRARRNAINQLSREQIESVAGRLNANQFTLLNREQQDWYTNATNARNANQGGSTAVSEAPRRRTLNQLYAQAYRSGGSQRAVEMRFQELARQNGYENVVMTPEGPREMGRVVRANPNRR